MTRPNRIIQRRRDDESSTGNVEERSRYFFLKALETSHAHLTTFHGETFSPSRVCASARRFNDTSVTRGNEHEQFHEAEFFNRST